MKKMIIFTGSFFSEKRLFAQAIADATPEKTDIVRSCITREPFPDEDQERYYFISEADFKEKQHNQEFFESMKIIDEKFSALPGTYTPVYVGVTHESMNTIWENGKVPILVMDPRGVSFIQKNYPDCILLIYYINTYLPVVIKRVRALKQQNIISEKDATIRICLTPSMQSLRIFNANTIEHHMGPEPRIEQKNNFDKSVQGIIGAVEIFTR
jgi:guanylate kinase